GGVHTVTTHHEGGHHHHSEHPSREAAIDHMAMAHGMDGNLDGEENPDTDKETPDDAYAEAMPSGGGIPGIASAMPASEIMGDFRRGELHSGPGGPIVKKKKQAKAILLSYLRKEGKIPERGKSRMAKHFHEARD